MQGQVPMVKELGRFMGIAVEELKDLCPAAVCYHTGQLHHALTAWILV